LGDIAHCFALILSLHRLKEMRDESSFHRESENAKVDVKEVIEEGRENGKAPGVESDERKGNDGDVSTNLDPEEEDILDEFYENILAANTSLFGDYNIDDSEDDGEFGLEALEKRELEEDERDEMNYYEEDNKKISFLKNPVELRIGDTENSLEVIPERNIGESFKKIKKVSFLKNPVELRIGNTENSLEVIPERNIGESFKEIEKRLLRNLDNEGKKMEKEEDENSEGGGKESGMVKEVEENREDSKDMNSLSSPEREMQKEPNALPDDGDLFENIDEGDENSLVRKLREELGEAVEEDDDAIQQRVDKKIAEEEAREQEEEMKREQNEEENFKTPSKTVKPIKSFASSYFSSAESIRSNYSGIRKEKGRLDAGTSKKDRQANFQKYRQKRRPNQRGGVREKHEDDDIYAGLRKEDEQDEVRLSQLKRLKINSLHRNDVTYSAFDHLCRKLSTSTSSSSTRTSVTASSFLSLFVFLLSNSDSNFSSVNDSVASILCILADSNNEHSLYIYAEDVCFDFFFFFVCVSYLNSFQLSSSFCLAREREEGWGLGKTKLKGMTGLSTILSSPIINHSHFTSVTSSSRTPPYFGVLYQYSYFYTFTHVLQKYYAGQSAWMRAMKNRYEKTVNWNKDKWRNDNIDSSIPSLYISPTVRLSRAVISTFAKEMWFVKKKIFFFFLRFSLMYVSQNPILSIECFFDLRNNHERSHLIMYN
jgi:hypothetical protein